MIANIVFATLAGVLFVACVWMCYDIWRWEREFFRKHGRHSDDT